jgi:hypothetical protein
MGLTSQKFFKKHTHIFKNIIQALNMAYRVEDDKFIGSVVRLKGFPMSAWDGAVGVVSSPPDSLTMKYKVTLSSPEEVLSAYPNGVHIQDKNLEIVSDATPVGRTRNNLWAINLTPTEQATWFTDCYRLQINEVSKGSSRRSIYHPDSKAWDVWLDFFIFCRCAVLEGVLLKEMGWRYLELCKIVSTQTV